MVLLLTCFVVVNAVNAQNRKISGIVTNSEDNSILPGVTVTAKGFAGVGTITDFNGKYSLDVPASATVLVFSFIGMETQEIAIGTGSTIDAALMPSSIDIEEVMVVGYGTQIKSKITGNISNVKGEALKNTPVPSVQQALQGKTAGVFIEASNGKSSSATRMRIRGSSSVTATNEPLFIIDGVPMSTESLNQSGASINPLTSINVNDIESVDVLKDASSTAIYGSRGANGVVLITTKKGKAGATKINVNMQYGFSTPSHLREFMNTEQFIAYFREAAYNSDMLEGYDSKNVPGDYPGSWLQSAERRFKRYSGWAAVLDPAQTVAGKDFVNSSVNTDWQQEAFQQGGLQMLDLSASGGTDKLKYYLSGSYNNQQSIIVGNGLERFSARLNVDNKINKFIDLGLTQSLARTNILQVAADNAFSSPMQLVALAPITPVRDLDGLLYGTPTTTYYNGLIDVEDAQRSILETRSVTNGYLKFSLLKGLSWRNEVGFDLYNLKENSRYGKRTDSGQGVNGYGFANYGQNQNFIGKSYLDYIATFGDYSVSAVAGTEIQSTVIDNAYVEGQNFGSEDLKTLAAAGEITNGTSTIAKYSFLSYFSRVNFDYKGKYLFTTAGRIDGSSRFGPDNRHGFFPAFSAGWVLTKEDFLADNNFISFMKIRTSYGKTGNAGIGNFAHLGLYGVGAYNSQPGLIPSQIENKNLGWETTAQLDFGFDFGFFQNRISGEIDYYVKDTEDLLLDIPVAATSGFRTQTQNIGSVQNKGFEFVLNTSNLTGALKWNTSFNFSINKNEVLNLGGLDVIDAGSSRFMNVVKVGQPLGVFYGAEYAGVDQATGDAIWYKNEKDANGNIINPEATTNDFGMANFIELGQPTPDLIGALTNTLEYKGIELAFTFQGVSGNKIHLAGDTYMAANGAWYDNQTVDQLNSWKKPGDITNVPQARLGYSNGDQGRSSRFLSDGSYIKLRSLTVSYTLPSNLVQKLKMDNVRVYMQGQNLYTFTKYIGWDPEVSTDFAVDNIVSGVDFYSAPQPRTITFGLSIGL